MDGPDLRNITLIFVPKHERIQIRYLAMSGFYFRLYQICKVLLGRLGDRQIEYI